MTHRSYAKQLRAARAMAASFLFLLLLAAAVPAQTPPAAGAPAAKKKSPAKPAAEATPEADPLAEQRRETAASLLVQIADDARSFRDPALRARAQARAADALWARDPEAARELFRRAWADADAADRESDRKREEDKQRQFAAGRAAVLPNQPVIRREVLRRAAARDRALGEEFLAQLAADAEKTPAGGGENGPTVNGNSTQAEQMRLGLAGKFLEDGDRERAVRFAEPALALATVQSITFLSSLRLKDAATADRLFAALVARAERDPASDANTVSILASYAFTPFMYFTSYQKSGSGMNTSRPGEQPPELAAALRDTLMRTAARILLRPASPQEYDLTPAGRTGAYLIIRRLLPLFERHAQELTPALNARAALLAADVPERLRSPETDRALGRGIVPEEPAANRDEVRDVTERAERASGTAARDDIYAAGAVAAAWRGDPRSQELAAKIVDLDLSRRVRSFADFAFVQNVLGKKDAAAALARARQADLTHLQLAWTFERAADLLAKNDRAGALALLDESAAEARRIDDADAGRARALLAVAARLAVLDRPRAWALAEEAAKASARAPEFTGEDGELSVKVWIGKGAWSTSFDVEEFNLAGLMGALAAEDFGRAVGLAQSFPGEAARVSAVVSVARAVLDPPKPADPSSAK